VVSTLEVREFVVNDRAAAHHIQFVPELNRKDEDWAAATPDHGRQAAANHERVGSVRKPDSLRRLMNFVGDISRGGR